MRRALSICVLLSFATVGSAQGLSVRLGGGFSPSFDASSGRSVNLQGPEIAVVAPFASERVLVEASYFGGGRLRHGHDVDSDVFRLAAFVHHGFRGFGVRAGVGYAESGAARGGEFGRTSGAILDVGVDVPIARRVYGDVHAVFSGDNRRGGFFAGVGFRI